MNVTGGLPFIATVSEEEHRQRSQADPSISTPSTSNPERPASLFPSGSPVPGTIEPESRDELLVPQEPIYDHLALYEVERRVSRRDASRQRHAPPEQLEMGTPYERDTPSSAYQGVPSELKNLLSEVVFVLVCSMSQLLFSIFMGNTSVVQFQYVDALGIKYSQTPWLIGAFLLANGLSVVVSGSLSDLSGPKSLMVGAFAWLTVWNVVGCFSISPNRVVLFFITRAMQGLAIGVLVSGSMSVLGRIYKPGLRKTRVFSAMAAMAPFGFFIGALQAGALSSHLPWIFGSSAILCGLCCAAAWWTVPSLAPAKDTHDANAPSMKNFDYAGATCATLGCGFVLFGLTQGTATRWNPYTYSLILAGALILAAFYFAERKASRPIIPNRLWTTPGFRPLIISYFLGFGSYVGAWQFFAFQFWLRLQRATPLTVALYLTPNAIVGVLATFIVAKTLHLISGHWILTASMVAYALGPALFLPQTAGTTYWALSMPGVALCTFGPDLSFAAASIFITSSVPRSYQGSAGSLLITIQNLSAAVITSVADSIGSKVDSNNNGEIGLDGFRAVWWFGFALSLVGALICATTVRIEKSEEKEHSS